MDLIDHLLSKPKRITYEQRLGGWDWKVEEFQTDDRGWREVASGWERHYAEANYNVKASS